MKYLLLAIVFIASILIPIDGRAARPAQPMQSPQSADFTLPGNRVPTAEMVRASIILAGSARGWQVASEQAGELTLRNNIRNKHVVVVNVHYDSKGVRVEYVSSENLEYEMRNGVAYIHPKYNEWVKLLLNDIVAKVSI